MKLLDVDEEVEGEVLLREQFEFEKQQIADGRNLVPVKADAAEKGVC